ncbi:MAG: hypothetical protein ACT4R6_10210 [Gemmatimonadaceae bacterium]
MSGAAELAVREIHAGDCVIRDCASLAEYQECVSIQEETWGRDFSERVPAAIMHVGQRVGGVTAGAFGADGRMLGFVFGLTGVRDGVPVHWSDMLAVRPEARGRHIGERLKQYQRAKVAALGVRTMLWTFDPLVARNAHFNITRLGALPVEYAADMYGTTGSAIHGTLPTDRFIVAWDCAGQPASYYHNEHASKPNGTEPLLNPVLHGAPSLAPVDEAPILRVQIPDDALAMIQQQPQDAAAWRQVTRTAFMDRLRAGYRVTAFVRAREPEALPYYILTRAPAAR